MNDKLFFSLRYKIILAFLGLGFLFSIVLGMVAHRMLEEKLFQEFRGKVGNITRMGGALINKDMLQNLIAQQSADMTPEQIETIEASAEYKAISDQLNFIRDTEKALIRYVYLVTPTDDVNTAHYVVDADVLSLKAQADDTREISHFNSDLDVAPFPILKMAFAEKRNIVEDNYVYDEAFKVNTVSGYAPVFAQDGKTLLALLGLDMSDMEVQVSLAEVLEKSIIVASLSLLVALLSAIVMGAWFTRGIVRLDGLVRSFAEKDFAVRADLSSNDEVGRLGFSFNHMAETIQNHSARLEAMVAAYSRFVPHDLLRLLGKKSILDVHLGDQIQREMSVLFSDIRNFTALSEDMSPKDNFNFINAYLRQVGPEIRSHNGIIDKYIGDGVMALFPDSPEDAINAAIEMQHKVVEYNAHRQTSNYPAIKIGIAVHTGKVMLGTIGEDLRMDGTVIADTVNLAARLEGLTKIYNSAIIISDTVLAKLTDPTKYFIRFIDKARVAGKTEAVMLYEVCDADDDAVLALKRKTRVDYSTGIDRYYAQDFKGAAEAFTKVLLIHTGDVPTQLYLEKARRYMTDGVPQGWLGITRYDTKH